MSNEIVLSVENVSKRFSIGRRERYYRLSESLESIGRMMVGMALCPPPSDAGSAQQLPPTDSEDFWALKDVSFEVKRGEVLGIIGRNGAGKSTLLKILSRITEPTTGRIGINGRVGSLLEVGTGFHPELTGRENIFLNGAVLGLSHWEVKKRFDEIVAFAEVETFLDTPVKRYSSGMYMRLAFAVAAHLDTEILIVDEVLAVGDAGFQKKCLGKMGDVASSGRTVLFVSHNLPAVRSLCQRIVWLTNGTVTMAGPVDVVIDEYHRTLAHLPNNQVLTSSNVSSDKTLRVTRVSIDSSGPLTVERPFSIVVHFSSSRAMNELNISLILFDWNGVCVFNSFSRPTCIQSGDWQARCLIPSRLLNSRIYRVMVMLVSNSSVVEVRLNDILQFEVEDGPRNFNWFGEIEGVVRPSLEWQLIDSSGNRLAASVFQ
jgi:lipopolysaccharide transport system ATP-binding protein